MPILLQRIHYQYILPARHVFSSLIGLNKAYGKLDKTKKTQFNAHLTLLDHHPTALARDLCLLVLLDDLMSGKHTAEVEAEIKATIFYTYMGALMPSYCYQRRVHDLDLSILYLFILIQYLLDSRT